PHHRDRAVAEHQKLDARLAAAAADHRQGQQIVILPNERMHIGEIVVSAGGWAGIFSVPYAARRLIGPPRRLLDGWLRLWFGRLGLHRRRGRDNSRRLFRGLCGRRLWWSRLILRGGGGARLAARFLRLRIAEIVRCDAPR